MAIILGGSEMKCLEQPYLDIFYQGTPRMETQNALLMGGSLRCSIDVFPGCYVVSFQNRAQSTFPYAPHLQAVMVFPQWTTDFFQTVT